jgi:regulatory protein spx
MITIYTTTSCQSCKKAIDYFIKHEIPFREKNIFSSVLHREELTKILDASEEGFASIISERSNFMKASKIKFDDLTFNEAQRIIIENPSIIKRPLILDEKTNILEIGYNKSEIGIFKNATDDHHVVCPVDGHACPCEARIHSDAYRSLRAHEIEKKMIIQARNNDD